MDPRYVFAWLETFADKLPAVYAVLGVIWLAAAICWIWQKTADVRKRDRSPEATLTLSSGD